MFYFVTETQHLNTSAIELAQFKRLELFKELGIKATILTTEFNPNLFKVKRTIKEVKEDTINLFDFYQKLSESEAYPIQIQSFLDKDNKKVSTSYIDEETLCYYVDYYDTYGFLDRRDYYQLGILSFSEFFADDGKLLLRQYFDWQGKPKLLFFYRGGTDESVVLTMIQLIENQKIIEFNNEDELRAHFFNEMIHLANEEVTFISDRVQATSNAFNLMDKDNSNKYQFFHSVITPKGIVENGLFEVYVPLISMLENNTLDGLICSTQREADDAKILFKTKNVFVIPVTFSLKQKKIAFNNRKEGQLISVARLDEYKRLDDAIKMVIDLHKKYPKLDYKIYGYEDDYNNYQETNKLKKLVADNNAEEYIHFCGFKRNLENVYNEAQLELLTSKAEGFAMCLLEAQEHGVPCISYDIPYGPSEIIDNRKTGFIISPYNRKEFVQKIEDLLKNKSKFTEMSSNSYINAERFSKNKVKQKWFEFCNNEL